MITLQSKEQWISHEKDVPTLLRTAKDKHKRIVMDLTNLSAAVNSAIPSGTSGVLPILHPDDPTSGIFAGTNPISIQFRIGGVTQWTIDATGPRAGA